MYNRYNGNNWYNSEANYFVNNSAKHIFRTDDDKFLLEQIGGGILIVVLLFSITTWLWAL